MNPDFAKRVWIALGSVIISLPQAIELRYCDCRYRRQVHSALTKSKAVASKTVRTCPGGPIPLGFRCRRKHEASLPEGDMTIVQPFKVGLEAQKIRLVPNATAEFNYKAFLFELT